MSTENASQTTNFDLNQYNDSILGRKVMESQNSILSIHPYYHNGLWVFDDDRVGLEKEPFVSGADEFIEYGLKKMGRLDDGKKGFNMLFSLIPFKGYQFELEQANCSMYFQRND